MKKNWRPFSFQLLMFSAVALLPALAEAALTMQGVRLADVSPAAFSVIWEASGPADPEITVFSDAAGTDDITRRLEVRALPLQGGDPASADETQRQTANARIRNAARALGHMKIEVRRCLPETTYYYRVTSRGTGGEVVAWPASGLATIKTARESSFLADAKQILVSVTEQGVDVDCTGWLVTAAGPGVLSAVSAFSGDGGAMNQAVLNLGRLFGTAGDSWMPSGAQTIELEIVGPTGGAIRQSMSLDFSADFHVATVVAWNIDLYQTNAPPVAVDQAVSTAENTAIAIVLAATDAEGAALTYTVVAAPGHGNLSGAAPNVTYTPAANYNGPDSFAFKANDGSADSNVATVSITVTDVLEQPCGTAAGGAFTVAPSENLCNPVAAPLVTTNAGTYTWTCAAGADVPVANCTATRAFIVTPSAGVGGTLSPDTFQTVNYNQARQLTATADFGYSILSVSGCGAMAFDNTDPAVTSHSYNAGPVTGDCTVAASFADRTVPSSSLLLPEGGANFMVPTYRISGSGFDTGSGLERIEISINGGAWVAATGTIAWSYDWTVPSDGSFTMRSRATDKAGNVETPGGGVTVTAYRRQPSAVTVSGRQLLLGGNPFTIKGVVYSPVPVGVDPETTAPYGDYYTAAYAGIQGRDLALLRQMGANAVLIPYWGNTADHRAFLDDAYNGGSNPVYVIAGFWVDPGLDIDPASPTNARERLKEEFSDMVETHRNHPAILLWSIGSGLNAPGMYGGDLVNLFSLVDELAGAAHAAEIGAAHPVTAGLADVNLTATIAAYDGVMPNLDVWGAAVSRGATFGALFADYETASGKPLVLLGYGIDAYDTTRGDEYENLGTPLQGDYAVALWSEIEANAGRCAGGTITEYSDEWWRGKHSAAAGCPDADPAVQSDCGQADAAEPDGYLNEEWRGIVRVAANGSGPDLAQPRAAYDALRNIWAPVAMNPAITESPVAIPPFGSVNVGQVSAGLSVTFTNTGNANLVFGSIIVEGANPADFGTRNDDCSGMTLVPAGSCTVGMVFTPTRMNARSAILSVPSNDPARGTLFMSLQGSGRDTLPPTGSVTISGGAAAIRSSAAMLTLTAVDNGGGAIRMCVSNTPKCTDWVAFAKNKRWNLTAGNGMKTVYVWFRDARGNATRAATPYTDTVIVGPNRGPRRTR